MENFDNYFDEGTALEKLTYAIDTIDSISSICAKSGGDLDATEIGRPLQLAVLRLQQLHKELEAELSQINAEDNNNE